MRVIIDCEVLDYDNLSTAYQEKLLREECEALAEIWRPDPLVDEFKEKLEKIGFMEPEVLYSGFSSQGDGACFDAKVDLKKVCRHLGITYRSRNKWECSIEVYDRHYVHSMTRRVSYTGNNASVGDDIERLRSGLCEEFYKLLEADYYSEISDERCLEELRSRKFVMRKGLQNSLAKAAGYDLGHDEVVVEIV
jgi:hypothetical protein